MFLMFSSSKVFFFSFTFAFDFFSPNEKKSFRFNSRFLQTTQGVGEYENRKIREKMLANFSHYSSPPGSPNKVPVSRQKQYSDNYTRIRFLYFVHGFYVYTQIRFLLVVPGFYVQATTVSPLRKYLILTEISSPLLFTSPL